ncbi:hypothetical protein CMsap09_03295 [Clavibacter michiganensis]|uniref:Uncharacterized protein n=1 Tax=Clavibacter michiganensis TaxID=28447 RepID=A0A251XR62_9MICO|nr:hypothetical protein CMsap09_03295 [Clavibacter michiganensis]
MTTRTIDLHERVHALRRVSSIPLIVVGAAVALVALLVGSALPVAGPVSGSVVTVLAALVLWLALRVVSARQGLGMGRERLGVVVLVACGAATLVIVPLLLGPAFLLGVLLFAVGWRLEDRRQWITGAVVAVVAIPLSRPLLEDAIAPYGRFVTGDPLIRASADDVVLLIIGFAVLGMGLLAWRREDRITRAPRA